MRATRRTATTMKIHVYKDSDCLLKLKSQEKARRECKGLGKRGGGMPHGDNQRSRKIEKNSGVEKMKDGSNHGEEAKRVVKLMMPRVGKGRKRWREGTHKMRLEGVVTRTQEEMGKNAKGALGVHGSK